MRSPVVTLNVRVHVRVHVRVCYQRVWSCSVLPMVSAVRFARFVGVGPQPPHAALLRLANSGLITNARASTAPPVATRNCQSFQGI